MWNCSRCNVLIEKEKIKKLAEFRGIYKVVYRKVLCSYCYEILKKKKTFIRELELKK